MVVPNMDPAKSETFDSTSDVRAIRQVGCRARRDLPQAVRLGLLLTLRAYRTRYRANRLGYLWIFISPFLYAMVFVTVREGMAAQGLSIDTGGIPPGVFAFVGVVLFQVWIQALLAQADSLREHGRIMTEVRLPPETYFFSTFFASLIDLVVRLLLIAGALLAFGVVPAETFYWVPVAGLSLVVTGHAIGFLILPFTTVYRDLQTAIRSLSLGILLASPIFYPATTDSTAILFYINQLNPLAAGVSTLRDTLFGGDFVLLGAAIAWTLVLGLATVVWMLAMRIMHPLLTERLG